MGTLALLAGAIVATAAILAAIRWPNWERRLLGAALGLLSLAVAQLVFLLATQDVSYAIVANHTRPGLDVFRRVMGLWGGSAGSLLFFTVIVGWVLYAAPLQSPMRLGRPLAVAILAWSSLLAASPFERLDHPAIAGSGLTPILEHWAMLIHPPLLYLGLALALVPGAVGPHQRQRWTSAAIGVLTTALALGGGWSYVELGWGGWWAWDPVENAALIPWLLLVAGLHVPPNHPVARWSALLIWPLVFAGAAMTRTSLRTSVHAFANNETLAWTLWPLALAVGLLAVAHAVRGEHGRPQIERRLLLPVIVLLSTAVVVALGTFRPFVPGDSTDGSFYTRFLFPLVVIGLVGLGVAPRVGRAAATRMILEGFVGAIVSLGLTAAVGWTSWWQLVLGAALGAGAATIITNGVRSVAQTLAHLGILLVIAGALGATASTTETFVLTLDQRFELVGHTIINDGVQLTSEDPFVIEATIRVDGDSLTPSLAVYPERQLRLPEVATKRTVLEDIQLVLRSADDDGSVTITVNIEPLTQFVWIGAVLIVIAMLVRTAMDQSERFSRRALSNSFTVAEDAGAGAGAGAGADSEAVGGSEPAVGTEADAATGSTGDVAS